LITCKDTFWCTFCEKPLFFPPLCTNH
jgi:hypothetical protein